LPTRKEDVQLWHASCCPFAVILSSEVRVVQSAAQFIHLLQCVAAIFNRLFIVLLRSFNAFLLFLSLFLVVTAPPPTQLTGNPLASTVASYVLNIF